MKRFCWNSLWQLGISNLTTFGVRLSSKNVMHITPERVLKLTIFHSKTLYNFVSKNANLNVNLNT